MHPHLISQLIAARQADLIASAQQQRLARQARAARRARPPSAAAPRPCWRPCAACRGAGRHLTPSRRHRPAPARPRRRRHPANPTHSNSPRRNRPTPTSPASPCPASTPCTRTRPPSPASPASPPAPRPAGTGARLSAQVIASTLTGRRSSKALLGRGPPSLLSQFLSHSPPSAAVHQRPPESRSGRSRTVADCGERWSTLLESVWGATPREVESRILRHADLQEHPG